MAIHFNDILGEIIGKIHKTKPRCYVVASVLDQKQKHSLYSDDWMIEGIFYQLNQMWQGIESNKRMYLIG